MENANYNIEFLTSDEKNSISSPVLEKIKSEWNKKLEELTDLQKEIEIKQTNSDQHKFQVEKELIDLRKVIEEECQLKTKAQNQLSSLKDIVEKQNENLENANVKINALQQQLQQCKVEHDALIEHSSSITANLESKSKLNNELKEQLNHLEEQFAISQRSKCDALIQAEDASAAKLQIQYKERRYEQEKDLLSHQLKLLQEQLEKRSEEVLGLRRDHSSSVLTLQADFNHTSEEARLLREEREALLKENNEKSRRIQELLKSLNETRESGSQLDSSYKKELAAQEKLTNIFKAQSESQQKHCEELENGVQELRQLLQEASEQYGALEKAKAHAEKVAEEALDEKDLLIKDLKEELHKVNELIKSSRKDDDTLAELSPAAAAASQLMKKGLTLSQLYTEYLNTSEKLLKSEDEKKRLKRYVDQILNDLEEKAPYLRKQKENYDNALETINILNAQIENSIEDLEKQRMDAAAAQRRSNYLSRENEHLNQQVTDLSKQIAVLLTHVEAARAGLPPPPIQSLENVHENGNASDVIDQHLVTFRDVSELQEQNKKLLASLRELTDKLESAEKIAVEAKTQELQEELELARKELLDMKSGRERMQIMVENITRQRDMYRTVLNEQNSAPLNSSKQKLGTPSSEECDKLQTELDNARKEMEKLRNGHEDYRQERMKNEQMERTELEKLKSFSEKTKNENIRLLSQAEYNEERLKTLQNNCEAYQRQVNALGEKSDTLQGIIGRHEGTIESLREHTLALTKKLAHLEAMTSNIKEEKSLLKESEARLIAERDSLHRSQYSQSLLRTNLEAIKNSLDKNDSEVRMRFENQISSLTEQNAHLKAKIESNMDLKESLSKITSLEEQLQAAREEINVTKTALTDAEQQVNELKAQIIEVQEKSRFGGPSPSLNRFRSTGTLQTSPTTPKSSSVVTSTVKELQLQLTEERAKSSSLQNSLDQAQTNLTNLKNIVEQQESQIKESSESFKAAQDEINSLRKSFEESEQKLKDLENKLNKSIESENALKETMDGRLMRMTEDLEERENELEETQKKLDDAKKSEEEAREQMVEQSRIAVEMQDKYEREVMLHGADLQALSALKKKLADHNEQLESAATARINAEESLSEFKTVQEDKMKMSDKLNTEMKSRVDELEEQNKTLLDQFTQLSDKMSLIQSKLSTSGVEGVNSSFSEDEARSSEQLLEIIKYLRKEREVAAGKVEVMQTESLRLKAQKKCLEDQLNLTNKHLNEEREKNQASLESAGKYSEMMRKVHTLDALGDSNRLLREEKSFLKNSLEEVKAKVSSFESQIEPLQEELRETKSKLENLTVEKKSLETEKENYKKRSQELVEKLNRARPEDVIKLQQEVNKWEVDFHLKEQELKRLKLHLNQLQLNQKGLITNKHQLQKKFQHATDENKRLTEDIVKFSQEKTKLQQQNSLQIDKCKIQENEIHGLQNTLQQEQQKNKDQKSQLLQQILELRQKDEINKRELETQKKTVESKSSTIKELEGKIILTSSKIDLLQRQNAQLRKIANKYKTKVESKPGSEPGSSTGEEENEEKRILKSTEPEPTKLQEQIGKLQSEIQKKDEELNKIKSQDGGFVTKLQADLESKTQELQKSNLSLAQLKEKFTSDIVEVTKKLEESQSKKSVYESRIHHLEKEKEQSFQQIENLNKKISIQQKMLEHQKQTSTVQKLSPNVISIEKASDPPPTANIKPMAAPIPTPAVSSPRSQGSSQSGGSRSIPTASIRPMAPTSTPVSQTSSSIVVVPPMDTHSGGDGAVSSTVTLPQATVTPTPVAPASTTTQAFTSTLTATVSPTPVSQSSIASTAPFVQSHHSSVVPRLEEPLEVAVTATTSGSADALISQAIALVAPQVEDRSIGGHKRKLDSVLEREEEEEEELEDAKRSRILQEEVHVMEEGNEEDEEMQQEEDMGEPSSSSHPGEKRDDEEILVVSSDEEGEVPSSQSGRVDEEDQEGSANEGGREAEAEGSEENEVPSSAPTSSLQPPPRPLHEPPSSSSRQSLALFHQLPNYEEGVDDRIVPSTPTLFVSRPCEGTSGDGVSSPQVPSQGFEFGGEGSSDAAAPSSDGLSQIAEGGIMDVTRMDLAQLDDGSHAPVAPVPEQSSTTDANTEGNISSSADDGDRIEEVSQGHSSSLEPSSEANEEGEDRVDRSEYVVSSQEIVESDVEEHQVSDEEEIESPSPEEEEEGGDDEEIEEDFSEDRIETMPPARETRSSVGSQGRTHAPITWGSATQSRPESRGTRGREMTYQGPPRSQRGRGTGTARARRSRSHK